MIFKIKGITKDGKMFLCIHGYEWLVLEEWREHETMSGYKVPLIESVKTGHKMWLDDHFIAVSKVV